MSRNSYHPPLTPQVRKTITLNACDKIEEVLISMLDSDTISTENGIAIMKRLNIIRAMTAEVTTNE